MTGRALPVLRVFVAGAVRVLGGLLLVALLLAPGIVRDGSLLGRRFFAVAAHPAGFARETTEAGFPDARAMPIAPGIHGLYPASGDHVGTILESAVFDSSVGYAGPVPLLVFLDGNDVVRRVTVLPNDETPSFLVRIAEAGFLTAWEGLPAAAARSVQFDAVAGATLSSRAMHNGVRATLAGYLATGTGMHGGTPADLPVKTVGGMAVLLAALVLAWRFRAARRLRLALLVANVVVLGFVNAWLLSLEGLLGWLRGGFLPIAGIVLLGGAVLFPALAGLPRFYCSWVCPFGAAQELAGQLGRRKVPLSPGLIRVLVRLREGVLLVLLALLWVGPGLHLVRFEPFTAFAPAMAAPAVLVVAGVFLVLAVFVNRPWCRFLCPTGCLLVLVESPDPEKTEETA